MKNLLITTMVLVAAGFAQARTQPLSYMKDVVGNESIRGIDGKDTKCKFTTEWQENGDLKVISRTQYKTSKPVTRVTLFTTAKAVTEIELGDGDQIEYRVAQATTLKEDGDYKVQLFENLSFHFDNTDLEAITLQIAEVDFENDPHEDTINCTNLN